MLQEKNTSRWDTNTHRSAFKGLLVVKTTVQFRTQLLVTNTTAGAQNSVKQLQLSLAKSLL